MRQFDFYEFGGLLVPGTTVLLLGGAVLSETPLTDVADNVGLGEVGVGAVLAYGAGHIVQAVGNLLEMAWWRLRGGWPSDWVATGTSRLLHEKQIDALPTAIDRQLGLSSVKLDGRSAWHGITRQIYAAVSSAGRANRVDTFNGNYGLCRGLAAALAVVLVLTVVRRGFCEPYALAALSAGFVLAWWRAHRFAVHYARELFVQFLQLASRKSE